MFDFLDYNMAPTQRSRDLEYFWMEMEDKHPKTKKKNDSMRIAKTLIEGGPNFYREMRDIDRTTTWEEFKINCNMRRTVNILERIQMFPEQGETEETEEVIRRIATLQKFLQVGTQALIWHIRNKLKIETSERVKNVLKIE
ncbi:hypothetical protein ECANGB1_749 [Enterospora canceri]|uniref:Uncharacterized protein n=1 Tax=Enterospora canceri TaxID=1081671 RepID=A0A1Y1S8N9_9MICR|nr:hypothetical protein ECANGB1_749 [Enterospora canceri]